MERIVRDQKREPQLRLDSFKRVASTSYLMLLACIAGYIPGWLASRDYKSEVNDLRRQTRLSPIRTSLAEAALNANRGEFEEARRNSIDFFTNLQAELDRQEPLFESSDRRRLFDILSKRDEVITELARGDRKTTTILLSRLYFTTENLFPAR